MSTYVAQGILYFSTHPSIWRTSFYPLLLTLVVAIASAIAIVTTALYPQADAFLDAGVPEQVAWLLSLLLVILEIFVITLVYSLIVLPCYMDKVFEKVITAKGYRDLILNKQQHAGCCRVCASMCRVGIWMRSKALILTVPLNMIPIGGTLVYLWLNGSLLAWEYHLYYFELKGYTQAEQQAIVDERQSQYSRFGMQALFLEMIPGFGPLFLFTNTVGAALFAADMEAKLRKTQSRLQATSHCDDPPVGEYHSV